MINQGMIDQGAQALAERIGKLDAGLFRGAAEAVLRAALSDKPSPGDRTRTGQTARGEACDLAPSPSTHMTGRGTPEYAAAEAAFTEYFVRNYPGPDTIIFDPKWHAPKLFAAAAKAMENSNGR